MLAFNENGKLTEYEETNFLKVCDSCHHIYKQRVEQQLEGMREREYDICPLCGEENDSSMQVDFYNSRLTEVELSKLRKKALIKTIIGYCDKQYKQTDCFVSDCRQNAFGQHSRSVFLVLGSKSVYLINNKHFWVPLFPFLAIIFASFFRFMQANVSPTFISIRAFPIICV